MCNGHFPCKPWWDGCLFDLLSSAVVLWHMERDLLQAGRLSHHPANSVKALKATQITETNSDNHPPPSSSLDLPTPREVMSNLHIYILKCLYALVAFSGLTLLVGRQEGHPACKNGGWWRWALVSPDGVASSQIVSVSASVNLPLHHKVQKFSSGTGSPGWSRKRAIKWLWCGGV